MRHLRGRPLRGQLDSYLDRLADSELPQAGRDARLFVVDPVPAWLPSRRPLARLVGAPKHHLADPALAARLLGVDAAAPLEGGGTTRPVRRDGPLLGPCSSRR